MNRREFLTGATLVGGAAILGGAFWGRTAFARSQFVEKLMEDATPVLTEKDHVELTTLPGMAGEQLRTWFHGPCLNSRRFAEEVCSVTFAEKLAALPNQEQKETLYANAFVRHVVSASEICGQVEVIADQVGARLDQNWRDCSQEIARKWGAHFKNGPEVALGDLQFEVEAEVRKAIDDATRSAASIAGQQKALSTSLRSIGEAAILLLPISLIPAIIGVPLFVIHAFREAASFLTGKTDSAIAEHQAMISDQLASLARRLGNRFESEVKSRIAALQEWQEQSLRAVAYIRAKQVV